jgi:hypothetical protein
LQEIVVEVGMDEVWLICPVRFCVYKS